MLILKGVLVKEKKLCIGILLLLLASNSLRANESEIDLMVELTACYDTLNSCSDVIEKDVRLIEDLQNKEDVLTEMVKTKDLLLIRSARRRKLWPLYVAAGLASGFALGRLVK